MNGEEDGRCVIVALVKRSAQVNKHDSSLTYRINIEPYLSARHERSASTMIGDR